MGILPREIFTIRKICAVVLNLRIVAKVVKLHEGYELLRIKIYHKSLTTTTTDISSTLCEHLVETYSTLK